MVSTIFKSDDLKKGKKSRTLLTVVYIYNEDEF